MSEFKCRNDCSSQLPKDRTVLAINGPAYMNTDDDKLWKLSPANLKHIIVIAVSVINGKNDSMYKTN